MQCIVDDKGAHLRDSIINRCSPWRVCGSEEGRSIATEIIALRAEVIVDDIQKHHQGARMRSIDKRPQIVGRAVGAVRCIKQNAVVAPVPPPGKVGDGHELDSSDAACCDMVEFADCRAEAALRREGSDMQFQDRRLSPWPTAPVSRSPFITIVVNYFTRPEYIVRLVV